MRAFLRWLYMNFVCLHEPWGKLDIDGDNEILHTKFCIKCGKIFGSRPVKGTKRAPYQNFGD